MQYCHGLAKASKVATEADVGSCKVKLPTIIAITPLPLGRRKKFWLQSFSARSNPMSRKRSVHSTSSCEEVNLVILFHLLYEALGKSEATPRKALHPSHTKALFLLLSSFISRQAVRNFRSRCARGVMEAKR